MSIEKSKPKCRVSLLNKSMKLTDLKSKYQQKLNNATEIVEFIMSVSDIDEDEDSLLEYFEGRSAVLKSVSVDWLKRQKDVDLRGDDYSNLSVDTQPPLLVEYDGTIQDGAHRFEASKKRGDKTIFAYVLNKI